ncbi:MAG: chromosomal replication initiator protein DnaA [Elusimicrobiota bacterium]
MDNLKNDIWNKIKEEIAEEIKKDNLDIWFSSINNVILNNETLEIEVPNTLYIENISKKENIIKERIKIITGKDINIKYSVNQKNEVEPKDLYPKTKEYIPNPLKSNLNPAYTFEELIVHNFNQLAAGFSKNVVNEMGKLPLFIYSKPGLGKTHMLQAIGNEILKTRPLSKILYITAEDFVNEYINSINHKNIDVFRNKYRNLDCFLIDDIQFIVAKERSEEEFFFTFNALFEYKKQIVVASDRPPNDIQINERLISRFKSGLVADIKTPDYEARMAILNKENEKQNYKIPQDVIDFIAQNVKDSIRSLKGCLSMVYHYSVYSNEYPTIDRTKEWIKDYLSVNNTNYSNQISIDDIQKIIAEEYGITVEEIKSKQRSERFAIPRQIAMYIACEITNISLPDIGKAFDKDHSTVIYARDKIKQLLNSEPFFAEKINNLINKIKNKNVN